MIVIVDYGMGNLRSVEKAFRRLDTEVLISSNPDDLAKATKIVLPGVGHFERGMTNLIERNLVEPLKAVRDRNIPMLGICLGMQLMTRSSEEAKQPGLGIIDVETVEFTVQDKVKIPHMGWNSIEVTAEIPLLKDVNEKDSFYFAHSYHVASNSEKTLVAGRTIYGVEFPSTIHNGQVMGVQFHPEKSHDSGLKLLNNFIQLY